MTKPKNQSASSAQTSLLHEQKLLFSKLNNRVSKLNSFEQFVNNCNILEINEEILEQLITRIEYVKPLLREYEDLFDQFVAFEFEDASIPSNNEFEASLGSAISKAKFIVKQYEKREKECNQHNTSTSSVVANVAPCVKLPEISLLSFKGEISEFSNFIERFMSCVDRNPNLTDDLKLTYLQSCLKAPASEVLIGLPIVGSNYKVALDLLRDRYQNKRLLVFQQLEQLFESNKLNKENGLRNFCDLITKHLKTIDNLNLSDSEYKSAVIAYLIKSKGDTRTIVEFSKQFPEDIPNINESLEFLSDRCRLIDDISVCLKKNVALHPFNVSKQNPKPFLKRDPVGTFLVTSSISCPQCKGNHLLYKCDAFSRLPVKDRYNKIKEFRLCFNCISHDYREDCKSSSSCKVCKKKHHTLICFAQKSNKPGFHSKPIQSNPQIQDNHTNEPFLEENEIQSTSTGSNTSTTCNLAVNSNVLLSTAKVRVKNGTSSSEVRVLLDSGSQSNFITEQLFKDLNLKSNPINISVKGVGGTTTQITKMTTITIQSLRNKYQFVVHCLIINEITDQLPLVSFQSNSLSIPYHVSLADDSFNIPGKIDILLGASSYFSLIKPNQISLGRGMPVMQDSVLGWLISGNLPERILSKNTSVVTRVHHTVVDDSESLREINQSLIKLWEIDHVEPKSNLSLLSREEKFCETHFLKTIKQNEEGRLIVSLPLKGNIASLGESEQIVKSQFFVLERRLSKNPNLRREYVEQMREYINLGQMSKVQSNQSFGNFETLNGPVPTSSVPNYFLSHHCVLKGDSLTTKVRVVFNGSLKTSSNISLNDTQIVGPPVQEKLIDILIRFRQFQFALTGDIAKMYRMVEICKSERKLQRIFWRESPCDPLEIFEINRVTFGTASASFLATRCLVYLADKFVDQYPDGAHVIKQNFYMDDLLYSCQSEQQLTSIKEQVTKILESGCFMIRKFLSNSSEIMNESGLATDCNLITIPLGERANAKTLGVRWNSVEDKLFFNFCLNFEELDYTKRAILSCLAKLFDPLGILAPIIVKGKLILQSLWQQRIGWDQELPQNRLEEWHEFKGQLKIINNISVSRCLIHSNFIRLQFHGFCDASSIAYGACVYVRCVTSDGHVHCNLITSKSRVAPLHTVSIPRLELCAAVLLAELSKDVLKNFDIPFEKVFYWTDSMVTLNWINSAPNRYKVFVANRIAVIQELTNICDWRHVSSQHNPSDLISRGVNPKDLCGNKFWFHGPSFLSKVENNFEKLIHFEGNEPMEAKESNLCLYSRVNEHLDIFERFSCFTKLKRVIAYVLRFINNCKIAKQGRQNSHLTVQELKQSTAKLVYLCQHEAFAQELQCLQKGIQIRSSTVRSLDPFLDETGLIRVGGRLSRSNFNFNKKYPLLLPKNHALTRLIFKYFHLTFLHCGPQHLLSIVRESFWPVHGKNTSKLVVRKCIFCLKASPRFSHPLMGNLPPNRLLPNMPVFYNVGLDYAGPILIKDRKTRGAKLIKSYICIFICLSTRALHLELVSNLSTESFLNVLYRFIARRGIPSSILSDNGRNFVGANNYLKDLFQFFKDQHVKNAIIDSLSQKQIKWDFITPRTPHEGGLWERAVKSTKFHLYRVLKNTQLDYEDFCTVLTKIESVLNSKPLSTLPSDSRDLSPLTPGHFLILRSLSALPEHDFSQTPPNRIRLFNRMQQIVRHFWGRWSREVVPEYQRRVKWFQRLPNLARVGQVVLIYEDNLPPLQWPMGRIVKTHQGDDDIIRALTIKLCNGREIKRSIHRVCILPDDLN